jgi:plasmid stabilization system protein ParE
MKYRVITLPAAEADIQIAAAWMDEHLPGGAAKWVESIRLAIASLSDMPGRCPIASEYRGSDVVVRQLVHGRRRHRYRILFEIGDDAVRVLRVRHGAQAQIFR